VQVARTWVRCGLIVLAMSLGGAAVVVADDVAAGAAEAVVVPIADLAVGSQVTVTLDTGEVLTGTLAATGDDALTIEHPVLGTLTVPRSHVTASTSGAVTADVLPGGMDAAAVAEAAVPDEEPAPEEKSPWKGLVEGGLDGSSGNSAALNLRTATNLTYETAARKVTWSTLYSLKDHGGGTTEDRFTTDARHDWLFANSPWLIFLNARGEVDAKKKYDWRWASATGVGYRFIRNDTTNLVGRLGMGASQDVGGDHSTVRPEGLAEGEYEQKFAGRYTLGAFAGMYPDFDDTGEYRAIARLYLDIALHDTIPMKLRFGVEDRYDSNPDDGDDCDAADIADPDENCGRDPTKPDVDRTKPSDKPNDFDYYASLIWEF